MTVPHVRMGGMVTWCALAVATIGALGCLWIAWCEFPLYAWNDVRLAPAFALREGINPYPSLDGGPLFTWIYGPIGIFVNLPATLAPTILGALRTSGLINAIIVLGPLAWIFVGSTELRGRGGIVCGYAFALGVLLVPRPNLVLQVADHTAIAFGLLSVWCLARVSEASGKRLAAVAAMAAMAVWSKQISVFLPAAHLGYLALGGQRSAVRRYLVWFAVFNLTALVVFAAMFGLPNLWLNLVDIPAKLGWTEIASRVALRKWSLVGQIGIPLAGLLLLWRARQWPSRNTEGGRFFQLGVLAFAAMLPIGLFAFFKVGGDTNLLYSWDYLMPASLLLWLSTERPSAGFAMRMFAAAALALTLRRSDLVALPVHAYTRHFAFAEQLTARYPDAIWFPQDPLITYYANRRLWHSEDGVSTRFLAGYDIHEAQFRRHLPSKLKAMAFPAANNSPFSVPLLPELSLKTNAPYWIVYSLPDSPPP